MFLQTIGLMVSAVLLFQVCSAYHNCKSYSSQDSTTEIVSVSTHNECYLACLANPNCHFYRWGPNCELTVTTTLIDTSSNEPTIAVVICANEPSRCTAYGVFNANNPISVTHAECYLRALEVPDCIGYMYGDGSCVLFVTDGVKLDTGDNNAAEARVVCERIPDETTTSAPTTVTTAATPTTVTTAATPTTIKQPRKNCRKG